MLIRYQKWAGLKNDKSEMMKNEAGKGRIIIIIIRVCVNFVIYIWNSEILVV